MIIKNEDLSGYLLNMRKSIRVLLLCTSVFMLSGCSIISLLRFTPDPRFDGIYVVDSYSESGLHHFVYQFFPNNRYSSAFYNNMTEQDLKAAITIWSKDTSRKPSAYSKKDGEIRVSFANRLGVSSEGNLYNSRFYSITEKGVKFEFNTKEKLKTRALNIYSTQGNLLFSGLLDKIIAGGGESFILKYSNFNVLYNAKNNVELFKARYISEELDGTDGLMMSYKNSHFGLIDSSGKEVQPFIYDGMKYLGNSFFALMKGGKWTINKKNGDEVISLNRGETPAKSIIAGDIIPISIGNKFKFYSLSDHKYLNFIASRFSQTLFSNKFFEVKAEKGWVLINNKGKEVLPFYLSSIYHVQNYILATDLTGVSAIFTEDGKQYSTAMKGKLSPIISDEYLSKQNESPIFILKVGKLKGLVDVLGNVVVKPAHYDKIKYLGNKHFALKNGFSNSRVTKIYMQDKGVMPFEVKTAKYINGENFIIQDFNSRYGLWNSTDSYWALKPSNYQLIYKGKSSEYQTFLACDDEGKEFSDYSKCHTGVLKEDGTVIHPAEFKGYTAIYGEYFYNGIDGELQVYHLPEMSNIMNVEGRYLSVIHDDYLIISD